MRQRRTLIVIVAGVVAVLLVIAVLIMPRLSKIHTVNGELIAAQMARLHRLAHRVIWLNPLKENPDYAPLARGMKAALPHIDVFASGHNLASLEELAETVAHWG